MAIVTVKISPSVSRSGKPVVVVPRSVSKKATERNLIKRRIRAALRSLLRGTSGKHVIIAHPEALKASFNELKKEIDEKIAKF